MSTGFLMPEDFYKLLANGIPEEEKQVLSTMRHTRIEAAYRNRRFVVYQMVGGRSEVLANLIVNDFICNDDEGCSTEIEWVETGEAITVGYEPTQVFEFPIFVHLPVNQKVRWSARDDNPDDRSLSFLIVIRSQTRRHLRERDAIYMETHRSYHEEFHPKEAA